MPFFRDFYGANQIQQYYAIIMDKIKSEVQEEKSIIVLLFKETQTSLLRCESFEDT